jgi:gas vesicle protein
MCDNKKTSLGVLGGVVLGATIGAGVTFLLGTKMGRELQTKFKRRYPKVAKKLGSALDLVKENLGEKYEDVVTEIDKVKEEVEKQVKPLTKRFVQKGKKL